MLDLLRKVLKPAGINPKRRTTELTAAILQLVASRRGIAALPSWSVQHYLERGYVVAKPITSQGLTSDLFAAISSEQAESAFISDFVTTMREVSQISLPGITLL